MISLNKVIEDWLKLTKANKLIPLNLLITSNSMYPSIKANKDTVIIVNDLNIVLGDIILFKKDKNYILHRVIKIQKDKVLTMGDNLSYTDGYTSIDNILGKVVYIKNEDNTIDLKDKEVIDKNKRFAKRYIFRLIKRKIKNHL